MREGCHTYIKSDQDHSSEPFTRGKSSLKLDNEDQQDKYQDANRDHRT